TTKNQPSLAEENMRRGAFVLTLGLFVCLSKITSAHAQASCCRIWRWDHINWKPPYPDSDQRYCARSEWRCVAGRRTEQIEVQANAALVETRSTTVGQVIEKCQNPGTAAEWAPGCRTHPDGGSNHAHAQHGPIRSNRVFFFGGYLGTIIRQDASDTTGFVPLRPHGCNDRGGLFSV